MKRLYFALPIMLGLLSPGSAHASLTPIFDSLTYLVNNSYTGAGTGYHVTNTQYYGAQFVSNGAGDYLHSVSVAVVSPTFPSDQLTAFLYTNTGAGTGSKPDTLVGQIGEAVTVGSAANTTLTFTPTGKADFFLDPNTQFWIVLQNTQTGAHYVDWLTVAGTSNTTGAAGEYRNSYSGSAWGSAIVNGHNVSGATFAMRVVSIDAASVPEPMTTSLVGLGLAGIVAYVRRRSARQ